jgi:hypothetical protein
MHNLFIREGVGPMRATIRIRIFILAGLISILAISPVAHAGKVQLPEETQIKVKFDSTMVISSGKLDKGIPLLIYLAEPIIIGGRVIVPAGAQGKAEVVDVVKAAKPGKPGYIKVRFIELEPKGEFKTLDDAKIKLSGAVENKGKGKKLLSYLFIFGLFIKGKDAVIPSNMTYPAQVEETIILQSE